MSTCRDSTRILIKLQVRIQTGEYDNAQGFDREMHELFLKGRRYYEAGSDAYGSVLLLQVGCTLDASSTP